MQTMHKYGWMTVYERLQYKTAELVCKGLTNMLPLYLSSKFHTVMYQNRQLRSCTNNLLYVPKHNLEIFRKSISCSGPKLLNCLFIWTRMYQYGLTVSLICGKCLCMIKNVNDCLRIYNDYCEWLRLQYRELLTTTKSHRPCENQSGLPWICCHGIWNITCP